MKQLKYMKPPKACLMNVNPYAGPLFDILMSSIFQSKFGWVGMYKTVFKGI